MLCPSVVCFRLSFAAGPIAIEETVIAIEEIVIEEIVIATMMIEATVATVRNSDFVSVGELVWFAGGGGGGGRYY